MRDNSSRTAAAAASLALPETKLALQVKPEMAEAFARSAGGTRSEQRARAASRKASSPRGKRGPGLAVPAAIATSVVFVLGSAPSVLETGSAAGFAMVVGASVGLLVLMVGLQHATTRPWQRIAAGIVASVLVTMIEWAPPSKYDAGALTLQFVTMVVVLALGGAVVGMLRHTRSKVAALTMQKDREALDDFTAAIRFDPKHVGAYKARAEIYSRHEQFQNALQDSEIVLKLDPATPNAYCNVGFAHYAVGHDAEGRKLLNICYQKDPDPQTRGYYETEVRKVLAARQPRRNSGGGYRTDARERTPYDREMERQQNVYESLRNSGFSDRAEACRTDGSKC